VIERVERLYGLSLDLVVPDLIEPVLLNYGKTYGFITCPTCRVNSLIRNERKNAWKDVCFSCPVAMTNQQFKEKMYKK
jgi:hypothetical protein